MASCGGCNNQVDINAVLCPYCGRPDPAYESRMAWEGIAMIGRGLFAGLRAVCRGVVNIVSNNQTEGRNFTCFNCEKSIFELKYGDADHGLICPHCNSLNVFNNLNALQSPEGRNFTCFNCEKSVIESNYGDLENGGVICPYCNSHNSNSRATSKVAEEPEDERVFTCFNCGQFVLEMNFGELDDGFVCPHCNSNNYPKSQ